MKVISLLILTGALVPLAACASASAKAPAERPTLEVPAPPTKVIEPTPQPEPSTPEPVADLPAAPPTNTRTAKPPVREPARTDPKPEAPPAEAAPPPVTPVAPAPQLRTPNTPDGAEAAKQVHDVLERATKTLDSINSHQLSKGSLDQYEKARLLVRQSEDALKKSDFENAKKLAAKADDIANGLKGR